MTGTVKTLGILFDNEQRNGYSSGDVVSGHVLLELSKEINIKSIKMSAEGYARTRWLDGPVPCSAVTMAGTCTEERQCLSLSQMLMQSTDGEHISLNAGRHEIPFDFQLPQSPLVSSFSGKYGNVFYTVRAILRSPSHPDVHVSRELPVVNQIDINSPVYRCPISKSDQKLIGWWMFTSGPISLNVRIERKGYCNGESIPIFAEIKNCSSRLIMPKAVMYQIQTYMVKEDTKRHKVEVAHVKGNHIPPGCFDTWNGKALKIPPVSPSILNSPVLRVEYSLVVMVQIPGAKKLEVELPLVIGTVPFNGSASHTFSVNSQFSMDLSWLSLALPDVPEAPPNYADVVSEEEFEQHQTSSCQYDELERQLGGPAFAYMQEFRFQPPPVYSEVDPYCENGRPVFSI
ncbi:arrestin domain-containing protein 4-like [Chanos chanos]|uniref:Arrestin domain-containing protein 4-like n=1 Tax=Chanos chanos TaxID=29144 RepID=A0A6J2UNU2_CHACN|nr:arrestin domain-containing protein 4 [Chanos chanos]